MAITRRPGVILCDHGTRLFGEGTQLVRNLLPRLPAGHVRKMYKVATGVVVHVEIEEDLGVFVISHHETSTYASWRCLRDLRLTFLSVFGHTAWQTAEEFTFSSSFALALRNKMEFYSRTENDRVRDTLRQVDEVRETLTLNMEKLVNRGDQIDSLLSRTHDLQIQAGQFRQTSNSRCSTLRSLNWRYIGITLLAVFIIVGIVLMIVLLAVYL